MADKSKDVIPEKKKTAKRVYTPGSQPPLGSEPPRESSPLSEYSADRSDKSDPDYSHSEAEDDPPVGSKTNTPKKSGKPSASATVRNLVPRVLEDYFTRLPSGGVDAEALANALKKTLKKTVSTTTTMMMAPLRKKKNLRRTSPRAAGPLPSVERSFPQLTTPGNGPARHRAGSGFATRTSTSGTASARSLTPLLVSSVESEFRAGQNPQRPA